MASKRIPVEMDRPKVFLYKQAEALEGGCDRHVVPSAAQMLLRWETQEIQPGVGSKPFVRGVDNVFNAVYSE
jgi:hypothetical protein